MQERHRWPKVTHHAHLGQVTLTSLPLPASFSLDEPSPPGICSRRVGYHPGSSAAGAKWHTPGQLQFCLKAGRKTTRHQFPRRYEQIQKPLTVSRQGIQSRKRPLAAFADERFQANMELHMSLAIMLTGKACDNHSPVSARQIALQGVSGALTRLTLGASLERAFERPLLIVRSQMTLEVEVPKSRVIHTTINTPPPGPNRTAILT